MIVSKIVCKATIVKEIVILDLHANGDNKGEHDSEHNNSSSNGENGNLQE